MNKDSNIIDRVYNISVWDAVVLRVKCLRSRLEVTGVGTETYGEGFLFKPYFPPSPTLWPLYNISHK